MPDAASRCLRVERSVLRKQQTDNKSTTTSDTQRIHNISSSGSHDGNGRSGRRQTKQRRSDLISDKRTNVWTHGCTASTIHSVILLQSNSRQIETSASSHRFAISQGTNEIVSFIMVQATRRYCFNLGIYACYGTCVWAVQSPGSHLG